MGRVSDAATDPRPTYKAFDAEVWRMQGEKLTRRWYRVCEAGSASAARHLAAHLTRTHYTLGV